MYKLYKSTGLNNYLFDCLASKDHYKKQYAIKTLTQLNFKTDADVLLYIAMNI